MPRPNNPGKPRYYIIPLSHEKWYEIDPGTICKYTGLTDKNGKKIWENDILRRDGYWDIRIEFENGTFMVRNADKVQYINRVTCTPISTFDIKAYEVVGNIFDNADLLQVQKMKIVIYTVDDEEPDCNRCDHCGDDYICITQCFEENNWSGYERIELLEVD